MHCAIGKPCTLWFGSQAAAAAARVESETREDVLLTSDAAVALVEEAQGNEEVVDERP